MRRAARKRGLGILEVLVFSAIFILSALALYSALNSFNRVTIKNVQESDLRNLVIRRIQEMRARVKETGMAPFLRAHAVKGGTQAFNPTLNQDLNDDAVFAKAFGFSRQEDQSLGERTARITVVVRMRTVVSGAAPTPYLNADFVLSADTLQKFAYLEVEVSAEVLGSTPLLRARENLVLSL